MLKENIFKNRQALMQSLLSFFEQTLVHELQTNEQASILLSGGSTPASLYQALSNSPLAWEKVKVALVDERWLETNHEASNENFLRENLLIKQAKKSHFISMKNDNNLLESGAEECNKAYAALTSPFTICLLGMGLDGHTASLFPNAQGLQEAFLSEKLCVPIQAQQSEVTGQYTQRMTLSPWAILQSKKITLLFTGSEKWAVYQAALICSNQNDMPLSFFLQQNSVDIDVYWAP